jgi:hypothetical protein
MGINYYSMEVTSNPDGKVPVETNNWRVKGMDFLVPNNYLVQEACNIKSMLKLFR